VKEFITVGHSLIRKDARDKLTGAALYPQDIELENSLYAHTLRSEIPHGYFTMNTSEAETAPGVVRIFTSKDVTGHNHHGVLLKDHEVFCERKVRRVGDPLAFVVAETPQQAEHACGLIRVNYEPLPGVFDPREAMKPEAPQVHDGKPNLIYHYKCRRGDVAQGFSDSAVVIERHYVSPFVDHVFLQPESGLAYVEDDKVFIIASSQYPHFDQYEIAESIGWPNERVVILNPAVGGAFGGREDITMQVHLALAAIALDRPVKTTFSREESFYAHSKRHPVYMRLKVGADKEGKLLALEAELHGDTGAYASWAINVMRKAGVHITGPYEIPNVYVDSYSVYTNNPYAGAMRGFGATQVPIAYEQHMDILAEALGLTPFEIRMKNLFRKGSVTANGQVLTESVPLETCLLTLERAMNGETEVESHA
jgi:CO/xanthine dehydrogenase Mo-binding subunit